MKKTWFLAFLSLVFAVVATGLSLPHEGRGSIYHAQDFLDPLPALIAPYAGDSLETLNPYRLGHTLSGVNGMAFVYGTQARPYLKDNSLFRYMPLYNAEIVIAIQHTGCSEATIDGWQSLLASQATVLFPDNGMEFARLAAIALARGLGANEGDYSPAIQAFRQLLQQNRLNPRDEFSYPGYRHSYAPHRPESFDAVILWDYQAHALRRRSDNWRIIHPSDGTLVVDCGFVHMKGTYQGEPIQGVINYLSSWQGRQDLLAAGFSPFTEIVDLQAWDSGRLTFNPRFRREVRWEKLHAPASVRERLLLQSLVFLLFCLAAQRILRRIPRGLSHNVGLFTLLLIMLWLLTGLLKTLALGVDASRMFWFASFLPRHLLPVLWFCMCHVSARGNLPGRRLLVCMGIFALVWSGFVLANDWHRQVFRYLLEDPATWEHDYRNGWGYMVSLGWSFSVSVAGLALLFRMNVNMQQKRQFLYAGLFFVLLVTYQLSYMTGLVHVVDMDIPTTVAIFMLVFLLAAQQERFMDAALLALPVFHHSPYALAVLDDKDNPVYQNTAMSQLDMASIHQFLDNQAQQTAAITHTINRRTYASRLLPLAHGKALVLEDITQLKQMEQALGETRKRLYAIHALLQHRYEHLEDMTDRQEQQRYAEHMHLLLRTRVNEIRSRLQDMLKDPAKVLNPFFLRHTRFLVSLGHQRLRLIIRILECHPSIPASTIRQYLAGVMSDGQKSGLDAALMANMTGMIPPELIDPMLEAIDQLCLFSMRPPSCSLVCLLASCSGDITITASLTREDGPLPTGDDWLPESLRNQIAWKGGQITHEKDEDGLLIKIRMTGMEVAT